MSQPNLLPPVRLVKTGEVEHAIWNFKGLLGWIQRRRFQMVLALLYDLKPRRLLEIG
jgi:hypothetical protein